MNRMLAVMLLAGCGSSSGSHGASNNASGSGGSADGVAASCETRAADLAAWATTVDRTYGGDLMASGKLVEDRDALPVTPRRGRVTGVMVTHDAISVDGRPATDANAIAARISDVHHADPASTVVLFIDRDAPISLVAVAATGAVAAGARDVQIAVARPVTPLPPPPRSAVTDELAASAADAPSEHAIAIAHVMQRVIAGCPPIVRALSERASAGATSKAQILIDALRPALVECSCSIDLDALRSTLWALLGPGPHPPAGLVPVTLAAGDDRGAAIATGATWGDAAPALIAAAAAGKRVRIVAPASR